MRKALLMFLLMAAGLCACEGDKDMNAYDAYRNWAARNTAWFVLKADTARMAIEEARAQAKAQHGSADAIDPSTGEPMWMQYTPWRMYRTLSLAHGVQLADSIVMRIVKGGDGARPCYNDTVYVNYRGWLMPNDYRVDGRDTTYCMVFDQSFYGPYSADETIAFDDATAYPRKSSVNAFVDGFNSALQYMRVGDQAHVYIPSALGYGDKQTNSIPPATTLHFFVQLRAVYPVGTDVPDWK